MSLVFAGDLLPRNPLDTTWLPPGSRLVANLECAIGSGVVASHKAYAVVLPEHVINFVVQGPFAALNVANNHALDAGERAFAAMVSTLETQTAAQIFGTSDRPFAELVEQGRRCAVIGCLERCRSRGGRLFPIEQVAILVRQLRDRFDRVFVTPHWGKEGEYACHPSPRQCTLARQWIRAGADAVLGHHSHTVHSRERVEGRPVYYSLGNLMFDLEECHRYPLARYGLTVHWTPAERSSQDVWEERFVVDRQGHVGLAGEEIARAMSWYLQAISGDISANPWTWWRWARAVGPVYIPKSAHAWARRLGGSATWKTRATYAAWNLLPMTILMRLGASRPDHKIAQRRKRVVAALEDCS